MLAVLPALVLAASPASSPLAGCTATRDSEGWDYVCDRTLYVSVDETAGASARDGRRVREDTVELFLKSQPGAATRTDEVRELDGRSVEVVRVELRDRGTTAFFVALSRREGTRSLWCVESTGSGRCGDALAYLAASAWNAGAAPGARKAKAPPLQLAGRDVRVPAGCRGVPNGRAGRVECDAANEAFWGMIDPAALDAAVDKIESSITHGFLAEGNEVKRDAVACRVAGRKATCRRLRCWRAGEVRAVALLARTTADGDGVYAACVGSGAEPAVCSAVFELE